MAQAKKDVQSKTDAKASRAQAIVKFQGKQHIVYPGALVECEKMDQEVGAKVSFDHVLCYMDGDKTEIGTPVLKKTVNAKIVKHYRDKKVIVFKKIRRHGYQRKKGHRQHVSVLEIVDIK